MKKDIGIMGGTFNPIHNGHVLLAKRTCEQFQLNEVLMMPSGIPPHKKAEAILDSNHRSEMVKLAIQNEPNLTFSDVEITRSGYSYTADTLTEIKDTYNKIYFIIGADSLFYIDKWYRPDIIMELSTIVVANRSDNNKSDADLEFYKKIQEINHKFQTQIEVLENFHYPISSSQIRYNVSNGISIKGMVPDSVEEYIRNNHLYI